MKHRRLLAFLAAFSILANLFSQTDYQVRFRYESTLFPENLTEFISNPKITQEEIVEGKFFRYVQFFHIPSVTEKKRMESEGLQFVEYLSFGCWLTAFPENFDLKKLESAGVRSVAPIQARWKISANLTERPLAKWAVRGDQVKVIAQVFPQISIANAARLFRTNSLTVRELGRQNGILDLEIPISEIENTARLPFVKWLEIEPKPGSPEDTHGRSMHRSNLVNSDIPGQKKYDATGVAVLCRDDGVVGPHIDFQGRIHNLTSNGEDFNSHGDGISGIMAGAGNLDPVHKGMASGATLYVVDYVSDFQDTTLMLHTTAGVKVTNSSYSDGCNDGYTSHSQTVDQQLFQNPTLMHSFSAGNSGQLNCQFGAGSNWGNITGGHKQAKNGIVSANLHADFSLEVTSSRGPATDGRIKPDVAAHGQNQVSTDIYNTYQVFGGTSAASPGTAGVFAQLWGAYQTIYGQEPPAGLIKAAILNTANDMGNPGPDFSYGWGHLNAFRAAELLEKGRFLTGNIENGESQELVVAVPAGIIEAKFMIYWPDPEASESAAKALVNDLDFKVVSPSNSSHSPYILNPAPNAATLALPATTGTDHLNNMEQVALKNPEAGDWKLIIKGFEVPQGPSTWYIVWQFLTDEPKLVYPSAGEGLVPGQEEIIHWDAADNLGNFDLEFSADAGQNWQPVGTAAGDERFMKWTVPNEASAVCKMRISRNGKTNENDHFFSVIGVPDSITIQKICPAHLAIQWTAVPGALKYDVFRLGQHYMDSIGTTADTHFDVPISNPFNQHWVSVRAVGPGAGVAGRRRAAVQFGGGLLDCPQVHDLRVSDLVIPASTSLVACEPYDQVVSVRVSNDGQEAESGFPVVYQADGNAPISELFTDTIQPGTSANFTFLQKLNQPATGNYTLKIWTDLADEGFRYTDTIDLKMNLIINTGLGFDVKQDFEGVFPPIFWSIQNPDADKTWAKIPAITGPAGLPTSCIWMNFYNYPDTIAEYDFLVSPPFDLTGAATPYLFFDLAYAPFPEAGYNDCLKIEAFGDCGADAPITIFEKCQFELATTGSTQASFKPKATDWEQKLIDISPFAGQKVVFRFRSSNGYGNNLYIDNIGVINEVPLAPISMFSASNDTICRGDSILFSSQATGSFLNYEWTFGTGAQPAAAYTEGPHQVKYPNGGLKVVKLTVVNGIGESSLSKNVYVKPGPAANFVATVNAQTVTFNNTTTNGASFFWEFGDGTTSTDPSPVHDYLSTGAFSVTLTATGECGTNTRIKTVIITTVGTSELPELPDCRIMPNPNGGEFMLSLNRPVAENLLHVQIFDARGVRIRNVQFPVNQALTNYSFHEKGLPKGFYQVVVQAGEWRRMLKLVIQ